MSEKNNYRQKPSNIQEEEGETNNAPWFYFMTTWTTWKTSQGEQKIVSIFFDYTTLRSKYDLSRQYVNFVDMLKQIITRLA